MSVSETEIAARLRKNLANVRVRIEAAAKRAGRSDLPRLVAVTKYAPARVVRLLVAELERAGLPLLLGESRPQALWEKAAALADLPVEWHLIGHLQTNKVRRTLPLTTCIHSADSMKLLESVSHEAELRHFPADVLLEVNVSGDKSKHGLLPDEVEPLLPLIARLPSVYVLGLMTMASLEGGIEKARHNFAALRDFRDKLRTSCPPNVVPNELSMGMSDDFEVAIEEGATIVRVGSALFEGINSQ